MDTSELGAGYNPVPEEKEEIKVIGTITMTYPFEAILPKNASWDEIQEEIKDNPSDYICGISEETEVDVLGIQRN